MAKMANGNKQKGEKTSKIKLEPLQDRVLIKEDIDTKEHKTS